MAGHDVSARVYSDLRNAFPYGRPRVEGEGPGRKLLVPFKGRVYVIPIPPFHRNEGWHTVTVPHLMPGSRSGDFREKTVYMSLAQAAIPQRPKEPDNLVMAALSERLQVISDGGLGNEAEDVIKELYMVVPSTRNNRPFFYPFHVAIPASVRLSATYKMFTGEILALFASSGSQDEARTFLESILAVFNADDELSVLDRLVIREIQRITADDTALPRASAARLLEEHEQVLAQPAFCQPAVRLAREDLQFAATASHRLTYQDRVDAIITLVSIHTALYIYRIGFRLQQMVEGLVSRLNGRGGDRCTGCCGDLKRCPLRGKLEFRPATGGDEPVRDRDSARTSFQAAMRVADQLSLNLVLYRILSAFTKAYLEQRCGRRPDWGWLPDFSPIYELVDQQELEFAAFLDVALRALVCVYLSEVRHVEYERLAEMVGRFTDEQGQPVHGVEIFLDAMRIGWGKKIHHHGSELIIRLAYHGGKGFIGKRGRNRFYFELGADTLLLLAHCIYSRNRGPIRYGRFIEELAAYGFVPERERYVAFEELLSRLGLLQTYSDAGEAKYVVLP